MDGKKDFFSRLLTMKGFLKLNYCQMGRESWHAIKKLFYLAMAAIPDSQGQVSSNKLSYKV